MQQHVKKHEVDVQHINTELMIIDLMNKGLSADKYKKQMDSMGLVSSFKP